MQGRVHGAKEFARHHGKVQAHMQKLAFKNELTMALYRNPSRHPTERPFVFRANATLTLKQRTNK